MERFNREVARFIGYWPEIVIGGDPYYNPNLTLRKSNFALRDLLKERIGEPYNLEVYLPYMEPVSYTHLFPPGEEPPDHCQGGRGTAGETKGRKENLLPVGSQPSGLYLGVHHLPGRGGGVYHRFCPF